MNIKLAYDRDGLDVTLPLNGEHLEIVEPKFVPGLEDSPVALRQALKAPVAGPPLRDAVGPDDTVGIIFSDITRPCPNHLILPAILDTLDNVPNERITLFNALGTHRPNTPDELRGMLGDDPRGGGKIADVYRIGNNNAFDRSTQILIGTSARGNEIRVNRAFMDCDFKLLTGFIEPHFFAGYSGGPKGIMPGVAALETVMSNHGASHIGNPKSTFGVTYGNPIWEEMLAIAQRPGPSFLLNVTLNEQRQITNVFAGNLIDAHKTGCEYVARTAMQPVEKPFDVVVTTNSGYPLDLNLYQGVKGMSAGARIVKEGGTLILACECREGVPEHSPMDQLLRTARSPEEVLSLLATPGFEKPDQWQAQIQALIQRKADVRVYSSLDAETLRAAHLTPCEDISAMVAAELERHGPEARVAVLPQGPLTIPFLVE